MPIEFVCTCSIYHAFYGRFPIFISKAIPYSFVFFFTPITAISSCIYFLSIFSLSPSLFSFIPFLLPFAPFFLSLPPPSLSLSLSLSPSLSLSISLSLSAQLQSPFYLISPISFILQFAFFVSDWRNSQILLTNWNKCTYVNINYCIILRKGKQNKRKQNKQTKSDNQFVNT